MAAVGAFVLVVAGVAVIAVRDDGSPKALPKLTYGAAGSSATTVAPAAALADGSATMAPFGGVTYEVRGSLPDLVGTAPAFTVEPDASKARVDRLAAALGVPADHVAVDPMGNDVVPGGQVLVVTRGAWSLTPGSTDCSVSSNGVTSCVATGVASVGNASSGSASSSGASSSGASSSGVATTTPAGSATSSAGPDCPMPPCPPGAACAQVCPQPGSVGGAGPGSPATTIPTAPPPAPVRPADLPSRADAERIGRSVLEHAGVDLNGAAVRVDDVFSAWSVTAIPRVAGLPATGLETTITIGPKGAVVGGYGRLVKLTKVGDYPLAGSGKGLERLKAGTFAGPVPMAAAGQPAAPAPERGVDTGAATTVVGQTEQGQATPSSPPSPPMTVGQPPSPADGNGQPPTTGTVPLPRPVPVVVTITGVHLGLASSFSSANGRETLAPVYVFETTTERQLLPVPAVSEALLEAAEVPLSKGVPEPPPYPAPNRPPAAGAPGVAPASPATSAP